MRDLLPHIAQSHEYRKLFVRKNVFIVDAIPTIARCCFRRTPLGNIFNTKMPACTAITMPKYFLGIDDSVCPDKEIHLFFHCRISMRWQTKQFILHFGTFFLKYFAGALPRTPRTFCWTCLAAKPPRSALYGVCCAGGYRLALALLTPTALRSIPPELDWPKLGGSQGCCPEGPAYPCPGARSDSTGRSRTSCPRG